MNYTKAMRMLSEGKKIRYESWEKGKYLENYYRKIKVISTVCIWEISAPRLADYSIYDEGWEIYEEHKKYLTDREVMEHLLRGDKLRHDKWPKKEYIKLNSEGEICCQTGERADALYTELILCTGEE